MCHGEEVRAVSKDFTPEAEKQRLYQLVLIAMNVHKKY